MNESVSVAQVDYSKRIVPPNYECGGCGATGCKLWLHYNAFLALNKRNLRCAKCAAGTERRCIRDIDSNGTRTDGDRWRTDEIGNYVPAVPTETNETYWRVRRIHPAGLNWWRRLPTLPEGANAVKKAGALMEVIFRMIHRYQSVHEGSLDEEVFKLFEKAKRMDFAQNEKDLDEAIKDLRG